MSIILRKNSYAYSTKVKGVIGIRRIWAKNFEGKHKKILLFTNTSAISASMAFDIGLDGGSCVEYFASLGYDCYCVDTRGFGKSSPQPEMTLKNKATHDITLEEQAQDLFDAIAKIRKTNTLPICAIGLSWGCIMFLKMQEKDPLIFESMILINPLWTNTKIAVKLSDKDYPFTSNTVEQAFKTAMYMSGGRVDLIDPEFKNKFREQLSQTNYYNQETDSWISPRSHYKNSQEIRKANEIYSDLSKVICPTHILWCEYDSMCPLISSTDIYENIQTKNKTLNVIPNGGHLMIFEKNRKVLFDNILRFC